MTPAQKSQWNFLFILHHTFHQAVTAICRKDVDLHGVGPQCHRVPHFEHVLGMAEILAELDGRLSRHKHLLGEFQAVIDVLAEEDWQDILDANVSDQLSRAQPTRIDVEGEKLIPLDIDVAVFEDTASHKEGVSATYRKVNGYAPIFCYAGREGFMVANELRPGSQHSENGAVKFLKRCIAIILRAGYKANELLVRVDSGHDSSDFIKALEELDSDDAADVVDDLEADKRVQVLAAMPESERNAIESSLAYEDETAGRLMQREVVAAPQF